MTNKTTRNIRSIMKEYGFSHNENYPDYLWVEKMSHEWRIMRNKIRDLIQIKRILTRPK